MFIKNDQTLIAPPNPVSILPTATRYIITSPNGLSCL